jgi:hypothetical protein
MVRFTPIRAVDADVTPLTWVVSPTDKLGEDSDAGTVTAQVSSKQLPGCDHDNVVKLNREYFCGRGEVIGVLLNFATLYRPHRTKREAIQNGRVGSADEL